MYLLLSSTNEKALKAASKRRRIRPSVVLCNYLTQISEMGRKRVMEEQRNFDVEHAGRRELQTKIVVAFPYHTCFVLSGNGAAHLQK